MTKDERIAELERELELWTNGEIVSPRVAKKSIELMEEFEGTIRHYICEKIRNALVGTEPNCSRENFDAKLYDFSGKEIFDILDRIERGEE